MASVGDEVAPDGGDGPLESIREVIVPVHASRPVVAMPDGVLPRSTCRPTLGIIPEIREFTPRISVSGMNPASSRHEPTVARWLRPSGRESMGLVRLAMRN